MIETAKIGFLLSLLFSGFCLQSLRDLEEIIFANQVFFVFVRSLAVYHLYIAF